MISFSTIQGATVQDMITMGFPPKQIHNTIETLLTVISILWKTTTKRHVKKLKDKFLIQIYSVHNIIIAVIQVQMSRLPSGVRYIGFKMGISWMFKDLENATLKNV